MASTALNALGITFLWIGVLTLSIQCIGIGGVLLFLAQSEGRFRSFRLGRASHRDQSGVIAQTSLLRHWGLRLVLLSAIIQFAGFLIGCAVLMRSMGETWSRMSDGAPTNDATVTTAVDASFQISMWVVTLATPPAIIGVMLLALSCALPNRYSFRLHG